MLIHCRANSMRASRAFTLVELLVTIGVIGILVALILPVLGSTRATTRAITCLNNLQQWGNATHLYALDNDGILPRDGWPNPGLVPKIPQETNSWYVLLPKAIGLPSYFEMPWRSNSTMDVGHSIWICPSNPRRSTGTNLFHYCLNEHVDGTGTNYDNYSMQMANIRRPSTTVWMFDNGGLAAVAQQNNVHSNLHSRGAQFLFVDGHVTRFRNKEYWNFAGNKGITNNPELVWFR